MVKKLTAEFMGTFLLVFLGTGAVVLAKGDALTIALGFGLAITISAYAFGGISGGHFNPAVTTAMLINKRIAGSDALGYIIAQFAGATVASAIAKWFIGAAGMSTANLAQTDFPKLSAGSAFAVEAVVTFLFLMVILSVTSSKYGNSQFAGLAIGVSLALLIMFALNLTGGSLNPARSFGPAIFAGGSALSHLWVYILAPEVGAIVAAFAAKYLLGSEE
ncbi:MIP family glycerol uptake facilitator protein GlpF [Lacticaseibacillus sharpeae JCM 1186 = DSM 20505]|uniref:MIP family glycerol uptake facilitator protein GlpF n=1 Tax=Lacticaseibacillus sharpeae JCM 1186 = DSM 20505 TaxID=1291052 RepID=A0A0R1ZJ36_9LACO|nr:MIP family glycerol uptake facilitator protein GlpF [Lacticaseibacillus sharpeae JCM 1186 = DSM 20505]